VDQRADRRRAFHRVGQPDVQRELGRLAHRAQEQQQTDQLQPSGMLLSDLLQKSLAPQDDFIVQRAERDPEQEDAQHEAEVADAIHQERLAGRRRGAGPAKPEADQQVAAQAHAFPKYEQDQKVAGQHQHGHRKHEQRHLGEKPRITRVPAHVAGRIDRHQQADQRDHGQHDGAHRIGG